LKQDELGMLIAIETLAGMSKRKRDDRSDYYNIIRAQKLDMGYLRLSYYHQLSN
jgi:hypothetical protein